MSQVRSKRKGRTQIDAHSRVGGAYRGNNSFGRHLLLHLPGERRTKAGCATSRGRRLGVLGGKGCVGVDSVGRRLCLRSTPASGAALSHAHHHLGVRELAASREDGRDGTVNMLVVKAPGVLGAETGVAVIGGRASWHKGDDPARRSAHRRTPLAGLSETEAAV